MSKAVFGIAVAIAAFVLGTAVYFVWSKNYFSRKEVPAVCSFEQAKALTQPPRNVNLVDVIMNNSGAEKPPREIVEQILSNEDLQEVVRDYAEEPSEGLKVGLEVRFLDLTRDKQPEIIVKGNGLGFCTLTGNCPFWIYRNTDNGYELLLEAVYDVQRYDLLKTYTNGYRDIKTAMHGSAFNSTLAFYSFDGQKYTLKRCAEQTYSYLDKHNRQHILNRPIVTYFQCD